MKLKVGHLDYTVKVVPDLQTEDGERVWGRHVPSPNPEIHLSAELGAQRKAEVLLHELLHGLWLNGCLGKQSPEERAVDVLATGLAGVLRDNPSLAPALMALLEGRDVLSSGGIREVGCRPVGGVPLTEVGYVNFPQSVQTSPPRVHVGMPQ